jgi:hypothetical protein
MARTTSIKLTCDLPHDKPVSEGVTTITFGYDSKSYDLELCPAHATEYHADLKKYVAAATPHTAHILGKRKPAKSGDAASPGLTGPARTSAVRAWAREHGYKVPDRGRISADIVSAYQALGKHVPVPKSSGNQAAIRAWAKENGYKVATRGRLRPEIVEAYEAAR